MGVHIQPYLFLKTVTEKILDLHDQAGVIMLGYGRCRAMGRNRYKEELNKEAGTWFLPPGSTELGMEFVFHEPNSKDLQQEAWIPLKWPTG